MYVYVYTIELIAKPGATCRLYNAKQTYIDNNRVRPRPYLASVGSAEALAFALGLGFLPWHCANMARAILTRTLYQVWAVSTLSSSSL